MERAINVFTAFNFLGVMIRSGCARWFEFTRLGNKTGGFFDLFLVFEIRTGAKIALVSVWNSRVYFRDGSVAKFDVEVWSLCSQLGGLIRKMRVRNSFRCYVLVLLLGYFQTKFKRHSLNCKQRRSLTFNIGGWSGQFFFLFL